MDSKNTICNRTQGDDLDSSYQGLVQMDLNLLGILNGMKRSELAPEINLTFYQTLK